MPNARGARRVQELCYDQTALARAHYALFVVTGSVGACSLLTDTSRLTATSVADLGVDGASDAPAAVAEAATEAATAIDAADAADAATHPYVDAVLADDPVLYFRLDETDVNGVARDVSKTNAVGLFNGDVVLGQPGAIAAGTAARFDGNGAEVTYGGAVANFGGNAACTFEGWVKGTASGLAGYHALVGKHDGITGLMVVLDSLRLSFRRNENTCYGPTLATDTYQHFAVTYDGTDVRFFLDGVGSDPCALPKAITTPNGAFGIGWGFDGYVDEVAVYDRALGANEIAEHFAAR